MTLFDGDHWLNAAGPRSATAKRAGGYPPYDLEIIADEHGQAAILRITLAVAGFARHELDVSIVNGALEISGAKNEEAAKEFLYRGIAARQFKRTFALAHGVEVYKAELHNGLLVIELNRPRGEKTVLKVGLSHAR